MTTVVTIDGLSGVGKGALTTVIAKKLNFKTLDSGALYRLVALDVINHKAQNNELDDDFIAELALNLPIEFISQDTTTQILLRNIDVSKKIRTEQVAAIASQIASIPQVRSALLECQRAFATEEGLVADGRDMGTVVFPDAQLKIFLTANSKERAKRRVKQLRTQGHNANMTAVLQEIELRDNRDTTRKNSPLVPAQDAIILDTSNLAFEQVVEEILPLLASLVKP